MSEPATRDDLNALEAKLIARMDLQDRSIEGMRGQNSAEHGAIITKVSYVGEMMVWLKTQWTRFSRSNTWPGDSK